VAVPDDEPSNALDLTAAVGVEVANQPTAAHTS
jgi:hypothetical protein